MNKLEGICLNIDDKTNDIDVLQNMNIEFQEYLDNVMKCICDSEQQVDATKVHDVSAEEIYNILVSKEFNYQSKKNIAHLRNESIRIIAGYIEQNKPIKLYYSVGGGYKATINPKYLSSINYTLGLGELLIIYQVCRLEQRVKNIYSQGIEFNIIIDNGVANYVNDISIEMTEKYVSLYQKLIDYLGKSNVIKLIVQTRDLNWLKELRSIQIDKIDRISEDEYNNIKRFCGRECDREEALELQARYNAAMKFSVQLIRNHIGNSIWMLQHSNGNCLTFRPFPGGASRIQVGDVALKKEDTRVKPGLISTKNYDQYELETYIISVEQFCTRFVNNTTA